jgi:ascorbate-specific PTS system EIIC-type component UlaA
VLGEAGRLIGMGLVVGLASSVGAAMLMRKLLFGVQAWDAGTLVAVAVVLGVSAMLASFYSGAAGGFGESDGGVAGGVITCSGADARGRLAMAFLLPTHRAMRLRE